MKCNNKYYQIVSGIMRAEINIDLPIYTAAIVNGEEQTPQPLASMDGLVVREIVGDETGIGKVITDYNFEDGILNIHRENYPADKATFIIRGCLGNAKVDATIVINLNGDNPDVETPDYVIKYTADGEGGADYKTDVYMDGDGRVMVEREDDGSTTIYDEHENPIMKRLADGTTEIFDAYQSARMTISENGDVAFNGNVSGAGMEQYVITMQNGKMYHNDEELNFAKVKAAVEDKGKFVYLHFANAFHLPCFIVDTQGNQSVEFTSAFVIGGEAHIERVIINQQEQINVDNVQTLRINEDGGLAFGVDCNANAAGALAHGANCAANETTSHAEGRLNTASGYASHAEGYNTTASNQASHSEGIRVAAGGRSSHAEGSFTNASGENSHAEGESTIAGGKNSHAEGLLNESNGIASHAEGQSTIANYEYQHVQGVYNNANEISGIAGAFAHGCGTSTNVRQNAFLIVGSEIYVYGAGGYDGTNHASAQSLRQVLTAIQVKLQNF